MKLGTKNKNMSKLPQQLHDIKNKIQKNLPANIDEVKLNSPEGFRIFLDDSLAATMTHPYGTFIISVVDRER